MREAGNPEPENPALTEREKILEAMGHSREGITANGRVIGTEIDMAQAKRWAALGLTFDQQLAVIREVMARKRDGPPNSFRYFNGAMEKIAGALAELPLQPAAPEARASTTARPTIDVAAILATIPDKD